MDDTKRATLFSGIAKRARAFATTAIGVNDDDRKLAGLIADLADTCDILAEQTLPDQIELRPRLRPLKPGEKVEQHVEESERR